MSLAAGVPVFRMSPSPSQEVSREGVPAGLLEPTPDPVFDSLPALAAQVTGCPVALLGFRDADREWIRARHRWNVSHLAADSAPGWRVIESGEPLVVPDCTADSALSENRLVFEPPHIRFYAGVPIRIAGGQTVGVLEVFDRAPRQLDKSQLSLLEALARTAGERIDALTRINDLEERVSGTMNVAEQLRERDERFREIFDAVDDLIMTIRPDGRLMHFNGTCPVRLGYPSEELSGKQIMDLVHPGASAAFRADFDEILGSGRAGRVETTFVDAYGQKLVVEGTLTPKVVDGYSVLVRVIFRDITDRKKAELELGRARDEALEAARLKSQFLSNVSHEIRTPIHGIVGMLGLLKDSGPTAEQSEFINSARAAADSLLQTINNILHAARLESGKLTSALADFDLTGSVQRVVDVMQVAAVEKGLALEVHVGEGLPMIVRGDPGRYRQVLNNLIGNAIKFTDSGRVDVRLLVDRHTDTHTFVRVEVADTGAGIPEEARGRLFSSFNQVDASASRRHEGVGLGLSIARQLVELMNGAIGFDSRAGEGTTFWFTVPFERRSNEELAVAGSRMAFPGSRVLILDSSDTNRRLVEHYLGSWGMRHRSVSGPQELLERLHSEAAMGDPYHAVVLDYHFPSADVLSLVRTIQQDPQLADTAIVVTTNLGEAIDDGAFRAAGVGAYLSRPVEKAELFDSLTSAFARGPRAGGEMQHDLVTNVIPEQLISISSEQRAATRILLAEDKVLNQKLTLQQLRSLGYSAQIVSNGVEVVDAIRENEYDVILMDCQMPLMDGYEATKEVRRIVQGNGGSRVKIIAMTANALEGDREKCLAAGMDDYLSKPTRREELEAALSRALG